MLPEFTESIDAMPHKGLIIRQGPLLMFLLLCFTLFFPVFDPSAIAESETTEEGVTVVLKDFFVRPNTNQAKAGWLTLEAVNEGMSMHELVILKTDLNPAELPRKEVKDHQELVQEYLVNEDDARVETIDEIEEFPVGTSQVKKVFLEPGHYVLFCNIPGHYDKGMYTSLHIVQ
jgi:uncharacterized cupredoxin-like copper-binding protein